MLKRFFNFLLALGVSVLTSIAIVFALKEKGMAGTSVDFSPTMILVFSVVGFVGYIFILSLVQKNATGRMVSAVFKGVWVYMMGGYFDGYGLDDFAEKVGRILGMLFMLCIAGIASLAVLAFGLIIAPFVYIFSSGDFEKKIEKN